MSRLLNAKLKRDYVCAQCQSPLTEIYDPDVPEKWRVVCFRDRTHEGRIRKSTVERRQMKAALEGIELATVYPELAGRTQEDPEKTYSDLIG